MHCIPMLHFDTNHSMDGVTDQEVLFPAQERHSVHGLISRRRCLQIQHQLLPPPGGGRLSAQEEEDGHLAEVVLPQPGGPSNSTARGRLLPPCFRVLLETSL